VRELTHLHVIAIRYRNASPAPGDERGTDALAASGAYAAAGVPFDATEPRSPGGQDGDARATGDLCGVIADDVAKAVAGGSAVLVVGGNCSHAPGVLGGLERAYGPSARIGLVWFDAHGDFNTPETSPSGSLGGMPVAVVAGLAHDEWRRRAGVDRPLAGGSILLAGSRALDSEEALLIRRHGVGVVALGGTEFETAVSALAGRSDALYLHVDVDVLDASLVQGHRSAVGDGASVDELVSAIAAAMKTGKVAALAVVSTSMREAAPGARSSRASEGCEGRTIVESAARAVRGALGAWRSSGLPGGVGDKP